MANPLFDAAQGSSTIFTPRAIANLAARTARPGTQPQPNTVQDPYQAPEAQEAQEQPQQPEKQGWGSWAGEKALNSVAAVGNLLDLPGSSVRDALTGRNPLDQWLDPFGRQAETNRISGRDMLREKGLVGKEDNWKNFIGGMALEIATDPTTYLGVGALSRAGKAFSSIGVSAKKLRPLAKEMAETGSKKMGPKASTWIGGKLASFSATPKMIFDHAESILEKNIKPAVKSGIEGTFKEAPGGSSAWGSKADLDKVVVPPEKGAWAMVDNGQRIEVYKNAKEASEWVLDAEATRVANMQLTHTVLGATPKQLKNQWIDAHKTNYGKNLTPEAYAKLMDEDMEKPLRSLVSVGMPFAHPMKEWNATNNPEQTWTEWLQKQPDLKQSNDLPGGPPPLDASTAAVGPNAPKPSPKAAPVKDAAKEAAMASAQEEAAARSKVPPQQGRDLLKQLGRTDLDAIGDEDIAKEISRYGLLDGKGNLKTSKLGENATRALHQAARTFGPNGVDAFPVVETLAKTWGKLNGVDPDEYFKSLNVKSGDVPDGKLGKYVGDPSEIVTQNGVQTIMRMGERVITAMKGTDGELPSVATFMHEIGHDARAMFDSKMQKQMEDAVGAVVLKQNEELQKAGKPLIKLIDNETGRWTSEAEEIFANGFEAYLATGKPPLKGLAGAFEKLKGFIEDLWRTISGNPKLESYVHPKLKETFDAMLSPGKAKGPKAVAPPATAVSQAADAVDGQADEAAGAKPLPPDQGGGGSSAREPMTAEELERSISGELGESIPVNIDQIKQAASAEPIGVGGNAKVYAIDDTQVVRVPKHVKGEIADDFKPVDHPLTKLGIDAGQEIAENSQGVTIRQRQTGEEAGLAMPRLVPEEMRNELYASRVTKAADMPQEAYDKLAETIKKINDAGYQIDPSKSSNILIDSDNGKFNLVDVTESKHGYRSGAEDLLVMLMGNTYVNTYQKTGAPLTEQYRKIYDKVMEATKKNGLSEKLNSSGEWSRELAGGEKAPRVDLSELVKRNKETLEKAKTAREADATAASTDPLVAKFSQDPAGPHAAPLGTKINFKAIKDAAAKELGVNPDDVLVKNRPVEGGLEYYTELKASAKPKAPLPQENPLVQEAAKANGGRDHMVRSEDGSLRLVIGATGEQIDLRGMSPKEIANLPGGDKATPILPNPIQEAATGPTPIKEIPYSKNPAHNKELNRIHQSLAKTVGDDAAKAITPLVQEFVEAGNSDRVLTTTIESMSPEEMAGLAAKIAADKDGAANELLQKAAQGLGSLYYKTGRMLDEGKVGGKTNYDQFKATAKKYGVKDEELEDLNIEELFKDGKPKTRDEIRNWIDSNQVELKDVTSSKYEGYQVPGGDTGTYRELLISNGSQKAVDTTEIQKMISSGELEVHPDSSGVAVTFGRKTEQAGEIIGEGADLDSALIDATRKLGRSNEYVGPHFNAPNVIAHVRADEVTLPNGKKAMRVQEVQSDWHQKGKKIGYKTQGLQPKWDETEDGLEWVIDSQDGSTVTAKIATSRRPRYDGMFELSVGETPVGVYSTINEAKAQAIQGLESYGIDIRNYNGVPDGPFKKSWPELALKKILLEAAQKGYDEVQIVKGSDAAQAVGGPDAALSTFYDQILHGDMKKLTKKWGSFQGIGNNPKTTQKNSKWSQSEFNKNRIIYEHDSETLGYVNIPESFIGSKAADAEQQMKGAFLSTHIGAGQDTVKSFDSLKEAKEWLENLTLEYRKQYGTNFSGDVQVFSITPNMRQELLDQGLPLYQKGKAAGKGSVTFKETGEAAIKIVTGEGDASTAVHELAHVFRRNLKAELSERAEKALEQQLKDKDTIKNILGGKSDAVLKDANGNWTREAEEVWARLFEKYVREGKVTNNALKEAFEALKKMMVNVYKTLTKNPEINGKINPELRAVFDEMLGGTKKAAPGPKVSRLDPITAAAMGAKQTPPVSANPLVQAADTAVAKEADVPTANPIAKAAGPAKAGSDKGAKNTEELLAKWIRMNKRGRGYIGTFGEVQKLSGEEMDRLQRAMEKDPRFIRDKDGGYYPTEEAIASISKIDEDRLASEAVKTLDSVQSGLAIQTYTKGSDGPNAAVDPKLAAEGFAETRNARLPSGHPSRFTARKVNDEKWEVIKEDVSHKQSTPPTASNPIQDQARLAAEKPAETPPVNPIEAAIPKAEERIAAPMPNMIYDTAKQPEPKPLPPRVGGLMARAKAVDKEAVKQSAFVPSDELINEAKGIGNQAPAPKAGVQFTPPKDDVLPHIADAESVLGLGKDGTRLSGLDDLPVEKKQVFDELLSDLNGFGEGEREAAMEEVAKRVSEVIGREATPDDVQKVANWLDKTSDQFKRTMQQVDKEYVYTPDKVRANTKGDLGEKLRTLSGKALGRKNELSVEEIEPLVDHIGYTAALFKEGADLSPEGIKKSIKEATGADITERQATAASELMNSDQKSAAKLRESVTKQLEADSMFDVDEGGRPPDAREPFIGGKELEEMKLEDSVGKITQAELAKVMDGMSDEKIQAMAQKLSGDSGVAIETKGEVPVKKSTDVVEMKKAAEAELKDLKSQLKKSKSLSEKRDIRNQIEEIKEGTKKKISESKDADVQGMYRRMNALKMLAEKASDPEIKDAYKKLAIEVRANIAEEELNRAYKAADGLAKGIEAFSTENRSAINTGLFQLIDDHDYTKLPRIQSKSLRRKIMNEIAPSAIDEKIKRVSDITKDAEKAERFEANLVGRELTSPEEEASAIAKKATTPREEKITEVMWDDSVRAKMSPFHQEILDQARLQASAKEAAAELQMSPQKYVRSLKEVMDKITEIAQNRLESYKSATPAEAAKNVISHKIALPRWKEIFEHALGQTHDEIRSIGPDGKEIVTQGAKRPMSQIARQTLLQALDVGDNLFMANPATRMMLRLFDAEVMGAGTLEEQEIARMAYKAQERGVFAFREIMHPIVHYAGRQGFFDRKSIATKLIKEQKMERVAALKEADRLVNERNNELVKFFEEKKSAKLDHTKFGISEQEAQEFGVWLESVKRLLPEDLLNKRAAGLPGNELDDLKAYAPRGSVNPGKSVLKSEKNKALLDASVDSQISREPHLKNLPGGTPILNVMSLDEAISGIGHDEVVLGTGLSKATLDRAVEHILKNYKDELLTKDLMKNGVPTEEGMEKIRKIASSIAGLPKDHLEQQVPWFGNNFLRDLSMYFEQSYIKQSVSLAAQRLAVKNMITTNEQKYLLSTFFEQAKMDNHNAYLNVIKQTGRMGDYQRFAQERFNEWLKAGDITADDAGMLIKKGEKKAMSPADMAEEMMIAKMYAKDKGMGVSAETHEAAGYWLQGFSRPQEMTVLKQVAATALNAFKSMVTVPFAAFHGRNKGSGFMQNVFFGAYDPTANFADRYFKTERQAFQFRTGQPIKNIHKELPENVVNEVLDGAKRALPDNIKDLSDAQKDAAVTEWIRSQAFKYALVGDRMGISAEKITDTTSSLTSQSPGTVVKDKKNWFGTKNALLDPTTSLSQKANFTAFDGAPYLSIDKTGARPKLDVKKYDETTFTLGAVGHEIGSLVEDTNRVSPFLAFLKQGMTPEVAAQRVHMIQFDYSKLTDFEKTLKQFIPFYVFASKSMKLMISDLLEHPGGKQAWSIRAANRSQDPDHPTPEHIRRGIAIPLGKGAEGQDRYLSGFGLAWEDPIEMLSFIHGDVKSSAASLFTKMRPEIQAIPEAASGRSLFFDKNFTDLDPQVGRMRDNLLMKETKGLADPIFGSQALEFLIGKSPVARVPSTINGLLDNRKNPFEKLLNATTGVKVTDVNAESAARMRIDQYTDQLKELGGREMKMTVMPEWRKERMTPEELKQAEELQKMIRSIQSELKERKKQAQVNSLRSAAEGGGIG